MVLVNCCSTRALMMLHTPMPTPDFPYLLGDYRLLVLQFLESPFLRLALLLSFQLPQASLTELGK